MNFQKVDFEDDLEDMEPDELRGLIGKFTEAQKANVGTFEEVADAVEEFNEYDEELTEEVVEHSSLSEGAASALPFSEKKNLLNDLEASEAEEGEEETEFEDRGQKGELHDDDDEGTPEVVEDAFSNISGIEVN